MKVRELMKKDVVVASPDSTISEIAVKMKEHGISSVVIVEDGRACGIVTRSDLVERVVATGVDPSRKASEIMSAPAVSVDEDEDILQALRIMEEKKFSQLPVTKGGRLVGIIALRDLLRFLARFFVPTGI